MKYITGFAFLLTISLSGHAQYYYKDLLTVQETNAQWNLLKTNRIKSVRLQSQDGSSQVTESFTGQQRISDNRMVTITQTPASGNSELTATYNNAGKLVSTVDTSADYHSTTNYQYDESGRIAAIRNVSRSGEFTTTEDHVWQYDASGKPQQMLRIRNIRDTTLVSFVYDGKDVPVEEQGIRRGTKEPTIYYYYNDNNQLTDIVRYNLKARRLLPTHVFSYNAAGRLAGMLLVPEGSNEYQRWYYDYDERGLKVRERAFTKQQQLMGRVEYIYE